MTTTEVPHGDAPSGRRPTAKRRRRQAPAGRALATGFALTATGLLVAVMGAGGTPSASVALVRQPAPTVATAPALSPSPPPTITVVIHRPAAASRTPVVATPPAGRAIAAPPPARRAPAPVPAATSSAS